MKAFLSFCVLVLAINIVFGQECGTLPLDSASFYDQPWIGNNQYLYDLIDSVEITHALPEHNLSPYEGGFVGLARWSYTTYST